MKRIAFISILLLLGGFLMAQTKSGTTLTGQNKAGQHFEVDTLTKSEQSPLDIAQDRGIFIVTKDHKLQLRILGSIRFNPLYDFVEFPVKNTFNSYYVPIGDANIKIPNFYSDLNQSRIGFEVTRKLENTNVFIRLETDFNGPDGAYRIRHAYGQIDNFLVGKTWSLFSNVSSLPATVDMDGPTGTVTLRTSQARFGGEFDEHNKWALAIEYSLPDLNTNTFDTAGLSTVQIIPDITGRIERDGILGKVQLSGVITTLSFKDVNNTIKNTIGWGASFSGTLDTKSKHSVLYQFTYGKGISHFITTFSGTGMDATYNPTTGNIVPFYAFGGFLSYGFDLTKDLKSTLSVGYADLKNKETKTPDTYRNSMSIQFDTFWDIMEGTKLGAEYAYAQRWNVNGDTGEASRISILFYYDF